MKMKKMKYNHSTTRLYNYYKNLKATRSRKDHQIYHSLVLQVPKTETEIFGAETIVDGEKSKFSITQ